MAGPGCRLLRFARVTLTLTANWATMTAATQSVTPVTPTSMTNTEHAPYSSRVAAVLAPCLVGLAIVVLLALALAVAKLRERRQTEGGFSPQQLELTSEGLTSDLLLPISLLSGVLLLALILASVGLAVAQNRRASHGTYSPSRQEKEGSRVEMWSISEPPPMERLI